MAEITGKALDIVAFLMSDGVDKNALWDLSPHKAEHSNQQRKYFHRLVGLLAKGEKTKFFEKKNELIRNYGNQKYLYDKNGNIIVEYLPDDDRYKYHEIKHYFPLDVGGRIENEKGKGVIVRAFLLLEGTSKYTAQEYVHLIDCTRNECLGCDIPMAEIETYEEKMLMERLRKQADEEAKKHNTKQ